MFEDRGVRILVAREHLPYVRGAEVDYTEDADRQSLHVNNPNVVYGCRYARRSCCARALRAGSDDRRSDHATGPAAPRRWRTTSSAR